MKKIISLILLLLMLFTMSMTAFAAEAPEDTTQELTGAEWDAFTVGEDYYIDENGDIVCLVSVKNIVFVAQWLSRNG